MFEFLDEAATSVNSWWGAANTADAVTADTANAHAVAAQPDSLWGQIGQGVGDLGRGVMQEGLGGLLDPTGMLGRQQAQRDLADRFQVVDGDSSEPRRDNQVTQAEYERIARTFSDVRMGRGDLTVDASSFDGTNAATEAADYQQGAMDQIANMMMTQAGRKQIENLHDNVLLDDHGDSRASWWESDTHHHTTIERTPYSWPRWIPPCSSGRPISRSRR